MRPPALPPLRREGRNIHMLMQVRKAFRIKRSWSIRIKGGFRQEGPREQRDALAHAKVAINPGTLEYTFA